MYRRIRKNLAVLLLSVVILSQAACTTGAGYGLNDTGAPGYYYDYGNPYYVLNPGYSWESGTPYYYGGNYNVYHDGYHSSDYNIDHGDYHSLSPAMGMGGFSGRR